MRILLFPALCTALLVSCKDPAPIQVQNTTEASSTADWPATKSTDGGGYSVTLSPVGGGILNNEHFSLALSIKPEKATSAPLKVVVDADMPAHRHGMNTKPELVEQGEGRYQVDGMLFHMAGEWVITVDVGSGEASERVTFPVLVE
jgi:hypothetical protein